MPVQQAELDTYAITLEGQASEGFAKLSYSFPTDVERNTRQRLDRLEQEAGAPADSGVRAPEEVYLDSSLRDFSLRNVLAHLTAISRESAYQVAAALMLDFAVISRDETRTVSIQPTRIEALARLGQRVPVTVSRRLQMSRDSVGRSALLAPSGAWLTWQEMLRDSPDGND
jgi:hypothetical protein